MFLFSIPFSIIACFTHDYDNIASNGFFHGYDWYVVYLVGMNAFGGLSVAMVVKYADNILKGFANSLAIIIICVASIFIFNIILTKLFIASVLLVIMAIFLYGYVPKTKVAKIEPKPGIHNSSVIDIETNK